MASGVFYRNSIGFQHSYGPAECIAECRDAGTRAIKTAGRFCGDWLPNKHGRRTGGSFLNGTHTHALAPANTFAHRFFDLLVAVGSAHGVIVILGLFFTRRARTTTGEGEEVTVSNGKTPCVRSEYVKDNVYIFFFFFTNRTRPFQHSLTLNKQKKQPRLTSLYSLLLIHNLFLREHNKS